MEKLRKFNLGLIYYSVFVIIWGAWVRISKSGDGCGEHWPLCHGEWVPSQKPIATWIEFSHRISTGIYGILILIFVIMAFKRHNRAVKWGSLFVLFFTITESLIGAQLVLKGLVGSDASLARAYWMGVHQVNSMLLTGSLVLCYDFIRFPDLIGFRKSLLSISKYSGLCLFLIVVASAGALAALSGTLFPSTDLLLGFMKDFSQDSHIFVRLRASHPMLACSFALVIFYSLGFQKERTELFKTRSRNFMALTALAVMIGFVTLLSLSPSALKMIHLGMAHILWMYFLLWVNASKTRGQIF